MGKQLTGVPSNKRELEQYMRGHGFEYVRQTKSGELWDDGNSTIQISSSVQHKTYHIKRVLADVKRALMMRPTNYAAKVGIPFAPKRADLISANPPTLRVPLIDQALFPTPTRKLMPPVKTPTPEPAAVAVSKVSAQPAPVEPAAAPASPILKVESRPAVPAVIPRQDSKPAPLLVPVHVPVPTAKVPAPERKRRRTRRYSSNDRLQLWERIEQLAAVGIGSSATAMALNKEGYRRSDGSQIEGPYICTALNLMTSSKSWLQYKAARAKAQPGPVSLSGLPLPVPQADPVPQVIQKALDLFDVHAVEPEPIDEAPAPAIPEPAPAPVVAAPPAPVQAPPAPKPATPAKRLPEVVAAVLTDPELTASRKVAMLAALDRSGRLPAAVSAVLRDTDLHDDAKIEMLMVYVEV